MELLTFDLLDDEHVNAVRAAATVLNLPITDRGPRSFNVTLASAEQAYDFGVATQAVLIEARERAKGRER